MEPPARAIDRTRASLGAAYFANFGALAASSPFLAVHLEASGFSPAVAAQLLSVMLLMRLVALPAWTLLADRTGSARGVLRLASAGALVAFAALFARSGPVGIAALLLAFALFRAPFGALLDSLLLHEVSSAPHTFGAVRAWGTAGYAIVAVVTGAFVARDGSRAVIAVSTALLAASVLAACVLRGDGATRSREVAADWRGVASLLRRPRVRALFAVALLQEIGLAPYDALFPAYLTALSSAAIAGVAVAAGAGAEFLFLLRGESLTRRLGPARLLMVACAASSVRWVAIAHVTSAPLLVALQTLHALSFGAFYLASVLLMDQETPASLRASGQGLFGSFAFGVAASLGLSLAGVVQRRHGIPAVFTIAAVASLLATLVAARLRDDA